MGYNQLLGSGFTETVSLDGIRYIRATDKAASVLYSDGSVVEVDPDLGSAVSSTLMQISAAQHLADLGWSRIEDAPRDGRIIICRYPDEHGVFLARYGRYGNPSVGEDGWFDADWGDEACRFIWWKSYDGPSLDLDDANGLMEGLDEDFLRYDRLDDLHGQLIIFLAHESDDAVSAHINKALRDLARALKAMKS